MKLATIVENLQAAGEYTETANKISDRFAELFMQRDANYWLSFETLQKVADLLVTLQDSINALSFQAITNKPGSAFGFTSRLCIESLITELEHRLWQQSERKE